VQIGTALVEEGLPAFNRLEKELSGILDRKGYESPAACSGKLKEL
jgi:dihydroorotate dehydrogenase (fumarate)